MSNNMNFKLSDEFVQKYANKKPPFGFNGLGELVYLRTYSRIKPDGKNEKWHETIRRVVEGTYSIQKERIAEYNLGWNEYRGQKSAKEMYDRMFNMKFLPPGRGLWAMGTDIINVKKLYAALNNCSFVSTKDLGGDSTNLAKPFAFLMDMSMLGVGVGFDVLGAGYITIQKPNKDDIRWINIPDTREGWVQSLADLLNSYFIEGQRKTVFNYDLIRKSGMPIKTFGGLSSGSKPLELTHIQITELLDENIGKKITKTIIVDIMNIIGKCVVSGNVRRTAELALGDMSDEYLNLKNYEKNPHRQEFGWTSNNSIAGTIGMNYSEIAERIKDNGEPGIIWLENMRKYSRMNDLIDNKDHRVVGANPCVEQSLEDMELCCLVETYPNNHDSIKDYTRTLKYAYLYAKTVTLGNTHYVETNRVMLRNRRIGCSVSGIAQFIKDHSLNEFKEWLKEGYIAIQKWDEIYSDWLAIARSIKTTSVKPSGTISLLAGATPGLHYPEARYYIRRIRLAKNSDLVKPLIQAGYKIEDAVGSEADTVVVEIPVDGGEGLREVKEISMWEQLSLAAFMQKYWSDNQVSCTVAFDPKIEGDQIEYALNYFQYQLKGISFLPRHDIGAFPQMPYEKITEQEYNKINKNIKLLNFDNIMNEEADVEKFCDGDSCIIK